MAETPAGRAITYHFSKEVTYDSVIQGDSELLSNEIGRPKKVHSVDSAQTAIHRYFSSSYHDPPATVVAGPSGARMVNSSNVEPEILLMERSTLVSP